MAVEHDPYSRVDYRRLIAWPERIQREAPLLEEILGSGPSRRLLDLGCGPGEHARFLASRGFEVVGVDRSEAMIAAAVEVTVPPGVRFVKADLTDLATAVEGGFGGALCLGNTLPHLRTRDQLDAFARGLRAVLAAGAPALVQILNYDRIFTRGERHLPLNFRPDPDGEGEIVFLRLMEPEEDGRVLFFPSTLRLRPHRDPPLVLERSRRVELRGWRRAELEESLRAAGMEPESALGGFAGEAFSIDSPDLLLVARARESR